MKGIEEQELAGITYEEEDGYVNCFLSADRKKEADAILKSLEITVYELAKQFKKNIFIVENEDDN